MTRADAQQKPLKPALKQPTLEATEESRGRTLRARKPSSTPAPRASESPSPPPRRRNRSRSVSRPRDAPERAKKTKPAATYPHAYKPDRELERIEDMPKTVLDSAHLERIIKMRLVESNSKSDIGATLRNLFKAHQKEWVLAVSL